MTNKFLYKERSKAVDDQSNNSKIIAVSSKKQITIPKEYFDFLQIGSEVEAELIEGGIFIRPIYKNTEDFSDLILEDLVKEGYSGTALIEEFRLRKSRMPYAVKSLIEEAVKDGTTFSDFKKELEDG